MQKLKYWVSILILGIALQTKAQLNTQFYFRHLSKEDGYTQSENTYFFQDTYGLTWVNSREGLNVYDSQKIKTFTQLPDRTITSPCFEDRNHNIWFSTQSAIYCYQRKLDKFTSYTIQETKKSNSELSYQAFYFDAKDHLWLQVKNGDNCQLYQFHLPTHSFKSLFSIPSGQCKVVLDPTKKVKQIIVANSQGDHGFWLIDAKNGIRKKKEFHFNSKKKTKAVEENWYVASIYPEGDSLIWFGLYGCVGLYHFKTDTAIAIRNYGKNIHYDGEMVGEIVSIQAYNKKYLLLSTGQSGLIFFNKEKLLFENQTLVDSNIENGLKSNSLGESYLDNHQNIWLIENNRSIAFANLRPFQFKQIPSLYKKMSIQFIRT